jgi:hypothetical protein
MPAGPALGAAVALLVPLLWGLVKLRAAARAEAGAG